MSNYVLVESGFNIDINITDMNSVFNIFRLAFINQNDLLKSFII